MKPFVLAAATFCALGCAGLVPIEPTSTCELYLDCLASQDPAALGTAQGAYGEGGTCWQSEAAAADCDDVCDAGLAGFLQADPHARECGGWGAWELDGTWSFEVVDVAGECVDEGALVEVGRFEVAFDAKDWENFKITATVEWRVDGEDLDTEFSATCTYGSGASWVCDESGGGSAPESSYWWLSGKLDGDSVAATASASSGFECEGEYLLLTFDLRGERP